jgi:hypothetical protein
MNANTYDHLNFQLFNHSNSLILLSPSFPDFFEELIHGVARLIACFSVTVSLLICMVAILFSCLCLFELVIQCVNEVIIYLQSFKDGEGIKIF